MNVVPISNIFNNRIFVNDKIIIRGWVRTRRDSKAGFSFLTVYDGSCFHPIQIIINHSLENYKNEVLKLTAGCSVIVHGILIKSINKSQIFELQAIKIEVIGWIEDPDTYPISAKYHSMEYLREVAHLRPRTNLIGAITRVRHTLAQSLHRFFHENGYYWIATPIISTLDTEGAGEMFRVSTLDLENILTKTNKKINFHDDFFGKETFLTVSGQLNAESYACALSKVYTFGPTFRAENSNTSRHLAEFWMLEPEIAFANLDDVSKLIEIMLKYVFNALLNERLDDMEFFVNKIDKHAISRIKHCIDNNFIQISYDDAINILLKHNHIFENKVYWGIDLSSEHERFLSEIEFNSPIIVRNYPKNVKAFYMRLNEDKKTVAAIDVLVPGIGEIIGGSQREERLEILDIRLDELGLNKENYWWYRDLRRYGTVPHSGFGLGFERLITYVTGIHNVKDVIPFPRTPRNANF